MGAFQENTEAISACAPSQRTGLRFQALGGVHAPVAFGMHGDASADWLRGRVASSLVRQSAHSMAPTEGWDSVQIILDDVHLGQVLEGGVYTFTTLLNAGFLVLFRLMSMEPAPHMRCCASSLTQGLCLSHIQRTDTQEWR